MQQHFIDISYELTVKFDDGRYALIEQDDVGNLGIRDRVRVVDKRVVGMKVQNAVPSPLAGEGRVRGGQQACKLTPVLSHQGRGRRCRYRAIARQHRCIFRFLKSSGTVSLKSPAASQSLECAGHETEALQSHSRSRQNVKKRASLDQCKMNLLNIERMHHRLRLRNRRRMDGTIRSKRSPARRASPAAARRPAQAGGNADRCDCSSKIQLRPTKVGVGQIHAERIGRAAGCRVDREASRVAEQIQKRLPFACLLHQRSSRCSGGRENDPVSGWASRFTMNRWPGSSTTKS